MNLPKDAVWRQGSHNGTGRRESSDQSAQHGSFVIMNMIRYVTAKLEIPHQWKIHSVFHTLLLTKVKTTKEYSPINLNPSPKVIDREEEYKVKEIVDSRKH